MLWLGMWAWMLAIAAKASGSAVFGVLAGVTAAVAAGLLMRLQWARLAGLAAMGLMLCVKLYALVALGFAWKQAMYVVGIAVVAHGLWKNPDAGVLADSPEDSGPERDGQDAEGGEDARPIISLVHLRSQQRYLEAPVLANALSEAWGLNIVAGGRERGDSTEEADGFVAGENPVFMVMLHKPAFAMFTVQNHDGNYFEDPAEVAEKVPNLRYAQIIRDHQAWLALDLVGGKNTTLQPEEAYRLIGKAISALADEDVMAILCPQHRFFNLWSAELETILCGDSPLDALQEEVKAPVIGVPDGQVIENAIAEARRRWPEFVASFKSREPDDERFIVKAPFVGENGHREHMWLQVFGLEPEYVHGHLVNHPMHTAKLKQGSQVEVPVAEVSDWVCPDAEGNALGNFTQQAIAQAAKACREA